MGDGKSVFIVLVMAVIVGLTIVAAFDAPDDEFIFTCGNHSPAHTVHGWFRQRMQELTEKHGCDLWRVAELSDRQ